jgi:hypothetical protein
VIRTMNVDTRARAPWPVDSEHKSKWTDPHAAPFLHSCFL